MKKKKFAKIPDSLFYPVLVLQKKLRKIKIQKKYGIVYSITY